MKYEEWKKRSDEYQKHEAKVESPEHYNKHGIETIDQIKASMSQPEFEGYLKGNILKYLSRFRDKGEPMKELRKAEWYMQRLIMEVAGDNLFSHNGILTTNTGEKLRTVMTGFGVDPLDYVAEGLEEEEAKENENG